MTAHPSSLGLRGACRHGFVQLVSLFVVFLLTLVGLARQAAAQPRPPADGGAAEEIAPDSPRASIERFNELCRSGRYEEAAQHLDLARDELGEGAETARRLKAILDRHAAIDASAVSPLATGDIHDGLAPYVDEVGAVPVPRGKDPIRMIRRGTQGVAWLFARTTVERIHDWYAALEHRWLLDRLPKSLLLQGPYDIPYWQWLGVGLVVLFGALVGFVLGRLTRGTLRWLAARTKNAWDDRFVSRLGGPLRLGWSLLVIWRGLPWLGLPPSAHRVTDATLRIGAGVGAMWLAWRLVDLVRQRMQLAHWAASRPALRALLPLTGRITKVLLVVVAAVVVVVELGYSPTSIVAGLGVGGLALALAAQKTVENLFGAFSIGVDQPLREGDYVAAGEVKGTVEQIGLRSTRIRTLDRTVVSIPNGKLAEMSIESYAVRDRFRLHCTLGLARSTSATQLRAVLADARARLDALPQLWKDDLLVNLARVGESSLDVEVMAWFQADGWNHFLALRGEALLALLEAVERAGATLAFPTRSLRFDEPLPHAALEVG